jgi:hypothetical protein
VSKRKTGKRLLTGAVAALVLLGATSYASPWWRLQQLREAVSERDAARVAGFVDFPALRENVKVQVMGRMGAGAPGQDGGGLLGNVGRALAGVVIDPLVDALVSPAGVTAMLEAGDVRIRRKPDDGMPTPSSREEKVRYTLSYRSWDRVAIEREGGDGGAFILHRHGLWTWKLGGIEMPRT